MIKCVTYKHVKFAPSERWVHSVFDAICICLPKKLLHDTIECAIVFVGDRRMAALNKLYRAKDSVADVLAFPAERDGLGDIVICVPQVKRQARRFGVDQKEEMARVLIHGVLHLFHYSHDTKQAAEKMFKLQEKIVTGVCTK